MSDGSFIFAQQVCPGCGCSLGPPAGAPVRDGNWSVKLPPEVDRCPHCEFEMVTEIEPEPEPTVFKPGRWRPWRSRANRKETP